jgi:hypothetical protein
LKPKIVIIVLLELLESDPFEGGTGSPSHRMIGGQVQIWKIHAVLIPDLADRSDIEVFVGAASQ